MKLYLVQHAEANPKNIDIERSLSETGKINAIKTAKYFYKIVNENFDIWHSNKKRSIDTALIFQNEIPKVVKIKKHEKLNPNDDPSIMINKIKKRNKDLMIIGHLPYLSKLSSLLILDSKEKNIINFYNSGIICIEIKNNNCLLDYIINSQIIT